MVAFSCSLALVLFSAFSEPQVAAECTSLLTRGYDNEEIQVNHSRHDLEFFKFVTRPDIDAPRWDIVVHNESAIAPGLWFVAPYEAVEQSHSDEAYVAPHIYDSKGELIWSGASLFKDYDAFVFKVSNVGGEDMLTALYPHEGKALIINYEYEVHASIPVGIPVRTTNMHEFQTLNDGTRALYLNKKRETTIENAQRVGYEGGECRILWHGIEERDIESGEVTFSWSSKDQIDLDESVMYKDDLVELCEDDENSDFLHLNSVEKLDDGGYLTSGRRTDTIYKISQNGSIEWRLGGKKNDFEIAGHFSGQHDIRCLAQNDTHLTLTILDNAAGPGFPNQTNDESRGLGISVNTQDRTAKVVKSYNHPYGEIAYERGNFQTLPNGNAVVFWTNDGLNSEYTPEGEVVRVAKLRSGLKTYRGYKFEWIGRPKAPPDVHSRVIGFQGEITTAVHVSWNGATEVRVWNLYRTNSDGGEKTLILSTPRTGFETSMLYAGYLPNVVLEGIDNEGGKLGQSEVFETLGSNPDEFTDPMLVQQLRWWLDNPEATSYEGPRAWIDQVSDLSENPFVTFLAGILFCIATSLTIWGAWVTWRRCLRRRNRKILATLVQNEEEVEHAPFYDKDS